MATTTVKVRLDPSKLNPYLVQVADASAYRAASRVAARANANVRAAGRVATGQLAQSYVARQSRNPRGQFQAGYEVSSPLERALWQEEGIGPVVPKRASVLRFKPKGSSVFIFRPRTKGFPGAHQLRDAYNAIGLSDYLP